MRNTNRIQINRDYAIPLLDTSDHKSLSASFFKLFKKVTNKRHLTQPQVDSLTYLMNYAAEYKLSVAQTAYVLATVRGETGSRFAPVRETFARSSYRMEQNLNRFYPQKRGTKRAYWDSRIYGNNYGGRGFVQITWKSNYQKFSRILGVDLVSNPELALDPKISALIAIHGMKFGTFTGKKLSDYRDFVSMRKIINGTDKANKFARWARPFLKMLRSLVKHNLAFTNEPAPYTKVNKNGEPKTVDTYEDDFSIDDAVITNDATNDKPRNGDNTMSDTGGVKETQGASTKVWWKSKTIMGGLVVVFSTILVPLVKGMTGVNIADPAILHMAEPVLRLLSYAFPLAGGILAIWGRLVAETNLSVQNKK